MASTTAASTAAFQGYSPSALESFECYLFYDASGDSWAYPLGAIDQMMYTRIIIGIHCGVRIGVAVVLFGLLFFVARSYRSALFCMYEVNFFLMVVSSALQLGYLFSFAESLTIAMTSGDTPTSQKNLSIASSVFQTILIMSLLATLVCQIWVACSDQRRRIRYAVTFIGIIGCFPTYFIWIWRLSLVGVQNHSSAENAITWANTTTTDEWVFLGAWRSFAASTSFCSLILCIKLWLVNRKRASMGIQRFDPIRILLTMAIQNSVIPGILAIVSAAMSPNNFGAQSVSASTIPITAVLLPMGYIWAQRQASPMNNVLNNSYSESPIEEKYATGSDSVKEYYLRRATGPDSP